MAQIYLFSLCLTISPNTVNSEQDYWDQQSTRFNSCFKDCKSFAISKIFWRTCRDAHAPVIIGEAAQRRPNYASKTIRHHPKTRNHSFHLEQGEVQTEHVSLGLVSCEEPRKMIFEIDWYSTRSLSGSFARDAALEGKKLKMCNFCTVTQP